MCATCLPNTLHMYYNVLLLQLIRPSANPFEQLYFSIPALKDIFVSFIFVWLPHGNQQKRRETENRVVLQVHGDNNNKKKTSLSPHRIVIQSPPRLPKSWVQRKWPIGSFQFGRSKVEGEPSMCIYKWIHITSYQSFPLSAHTLPPSECGGAPGVSQCEVSLAGK